jgi:hypothetical protein
LRGRGRHPRPGRLGRRTARLELTLENGIRLKIAGVDPPRPTPGDPDLDFRAAGPARSMARRPRNTVSPTRTGPGSLGARRRLRLRCRAGVAKWAGIAAFAGRRGAHRCRPRAL